MGYKHIGLKCKVCGQKVVGRQLCATHYKQAQRAGQLEEHQSPSMEQHFHKRYEMRENDCWEWIAGTNNKGYGVIYIPGRRQIRAHQLSYLLHKGEIPKGQYVLHSCDNKLCVNPAHLRCGTHQDNMNDAVERDRTARGARNGNVAITEDIVRRIRADYPAISVADLSRMHDISKPTVYQILNRKTWKHVA